MIDFARLRENRKGNFDKLTEKLNQMAAGVQFNEDPLGLFWYPELDKSGNGYSVIRFLPSPAEEDFPFVRLWTYSFKNVGGWYIENSLTSLGQPDPVYEYTGKLWSSGVEADKDRARACQRRLTFISNVFIVEDPLKPENVGKVFLFRYGKKIWDKLNDKMNPSNTFEKPMNPFDLWDGANLKLKIKTVADPGHEGKGWRNYDNSEFDKQGPLGPDENMEEIWKQCHSLKEQVDPSKFKSYDELKVKFEKVIGLRPSNYTQSETAPDFTKLGREEQPVKTVVPEKVLPLSVSPVLDEPEVPEKLPNVEQAVPEEDDELDVFKSLMQD